jgi:hypothetical protein
MHRRIGLLQKRHEDVAQNVFHAHAPGLRPHLFEDFEETRGGERYPVFADMTKGIVAVRLRGIAGIEIDHVGLAGPWDS